ncbi:MAG: TolC family outer membrane protein [Oceanospirillaceae bacterium]
MNYFRQIKLPAITVSILTLLISASTHGTTLQEVYEMAVKSDPLLQQATASLQSSKESIVQAKAALLPTLDGQAKAGWQDQSNSQNSHDKGYVVNLNQPVYSPALKSAYSKVKLLEQQATILLQRNQQDLIIRTVNAYLEAMIAKSDLSTAKAQERAIKRRLDRVNAEFEVGVIAITDVHEAQASYDNTKVNLIISEGQLENSLEVLQRLTNTKISNIDRLDNNYKITPLSPNNPEHWITQAIANNLNILAGKRSIESSQQDINIANSALKPAVNLQASHGRNNNSKSGFVTDNTVSLVLSMPLYSGGALKSKVRQALLAQQIEKSQQQDNIRALTQRTRTLIRDIQTNILAIKARKQSIISSRAALDAISEGFKVGTRNIVDLLQAEQALFSAQNQFATARLNHIKMLFKLKLEIGKVEQADIIDLTQWMQRPS